MPLSPDDIAHYRLNGWVSPIDVLSEQEAANVLAQLEAAEAHHPEQLHSQRRTNAHLIFPFLADLTVNEVIVDAVRSLVGDDISLHSTVLFCKEPQSASFVSWHQDGRYMALAPSNYVTAWLALSPSTRESGCVTVLSGTHLEGVASHHDKFEPDNILTRGQTIAEVDDSPAVDLVLRPGQMSLHHPWLIHGSQPNRSASRRVGLAMQSYLGSDVQPEHGTHYVTHISGAAPASAFVAVPSATDTCAAEDVRRRDMVDQALGDLLYSGAEQRRKL